jgi:hypothetical protein
VLGHLESSPDVKKKNLARMVTALCILFIAFISLCGLSHTLEVLIRTNARVGELVIAQRVILASCALVSIITFIIGYRFFPMLMDLLSKFELNAEGNLQHIENYMHEVVEMVKDSVLLMSEDMVILRTNEASKSLFGRNARHVAPRRRQKP